MDSNSFLEPLSFYFKNEPLYQSLAYMVKLNKYSNRSISKISKEISATVSAIRGDETGRTILDNIVLSSVNDAFELLTEQEIDITDDLIDYVSTNFPSIGRRSL